MPTTAESATLTQDTLFEPVALLRQIADTLSILTGQLEAPARPTPLMTVEDVAAYLNVSKRSVEQLVAEGDLNPIYVRSVRRFSKSGVDAYLRRCVSR